MQFFPSLSRVLLALSLVTVAWPAWSAEDVNVYSARKEALIKPLLDRFSEKTGIKVNLITGKADALLTRIKNEGRNSPADLLITSDAGRLYRAEQANVLQAIYSPYLNQTVPVQYRHPQGFWYGLSLRSRVILFNKDKVQADEIKRYEDLALNKWKGRVCIRSSNNIYNQSLMASMIASNGDEASLSWAKALVSNLARPPKGGDRDQVKAAAAGQCDLAVVNTYYLAAMLQNDKDPAQKAAAEKMGIVWPNQNDRGTHMNVSGAAVTKYAPNRDNAVQLLEFLVNPESQQWYAQVNNEFPVRADVGTSDLLRSWGDFKADDLNLSLLGQYNASAVRLMDKARWR